jgi:hypothetical protein
VVVGVFFRSGDLSDPATKTYLQPGAAKRICPWPDFLALMIDGTLPGSIADRLRVHRFTRRET